MILSSRPERISQHMYRRNPHATCTDTHTHTWSGRLVSANGNGIRNWHLMKRIVTLFYLFFCLLLLFSLSSHWFIADGTMVYDALRALPTLILLWKRKCSHTTHTHTRQLKYFVWFVVCVFQTRVSLEKCRCNGEFVRKENFVANGNDSLCHVFLGPKLFLRNVVKRRWRWWRWTQRHVVVKTFFFVFCHLHFFCWHSNQTTSNWKKIQHITFSDVLFHLWPFFPSKMSHLMILLQLHFFVWRLRLNIRPLVFLLQAKNCGQWTIPNDESFRFY